MSSGDVQVIDTFVPEVSGFQLVVPIYAPDPTVAPTFILTNPVWPGATLPSGGTLSVVYTFQTSVGESLPSPALEYVIPTGTNTNAVEIGLPELPVGVDSIAVYVGT